LELIRSLQKPTNRELPKEQKKLKIIIKWLLDENIWSIEVEEYLIEGGYYQHAYAVRREVLKQAILVIYFFDHPVEHDWWESGEDWQDSISAMSFSRPIENYLIRLLQIEEYIEYLKKNGKRAFVIAMAKIQDILITANNVAFLNLIFLPLYLDST